MRNVANGAPYTTSSTYYQHGTYEFAGEPTETLKFHTDRETNPWLLMDFGAAYRLHEIVIHNRSDLCQERAETIQVEASLDGLTFETLYRADHVAFGGVRDGNPLRIDVTSPESYRFARFSLQEENYFHLESIQVFAEPPAEIPAEAIVEPAEHADAVTPTVSAEPPPATRVMTPLPRTEPAAQTSSNKRWLVPVIIVAVVAAVAIGIAISRH